MNGNTVAVYRMNEFGEERMGTLWAARIGPDCNDFHCFATGTSASRALINLAFILENNPKYHLDPAWEPMKGGAA